MVEGFTLEGPADVLLSDHNCNLSIQDTMYTSINHVYVPSRCLSVPSSRGVASLRAGLLDDIGKMASKLGASGGAGPTVPSLFGDSPDPSWSSLRGEAVATPTGAGIEENKR